MICALCTPGAVPVKCQPLASREANKSSLLLPVPRPSRRRRWQSMAASSSVCEIRRSRRAEGPAAVLAIGTANPPNGMSQEEYLEFYFRATNSHHLTDLKHQLKALCKSQKI